MRIRYAHMMERALCLGAVCTAAFAAAQDAPKVSVAVEKEEVFAGEPFIFQIQVDNVNEAEPPDLAAATDDFVVEYRGGKRSSSESFNFVNGRTTRVVSRQYFMQFVLTAKSAGQFEIPAVQVSAEGQSLTTEPITIVARPPAPVEDFKLTATLSKNECFVGEPISMTTTYYIGGQVRDIGFSLTVLSSTDFYAEPFAMQQQPNREYFQIPVNGEEVIAEKGEAQLNARQFITLTFQHVLVPKAAGVLSIDPATASAKALVGQRRSSSPFSGLSIFDSREQYKTVIVPSEPATLTVRPVPEEGKPANFSGLIGAFKLSASASPTEVNVGDPITLTIALEGSYYLRHFELPTLQQQPALAERFRIPEEMAPGRAEGNRKVFTQTIRAQSGAVTEIPPIELAYFDTNTGRYEMASTDAIPLTVRETQVVTASDAEGYQQRVETVEHVAVNEGIAHNFTEPDALQPQRFGPSVWMRSAGSWLLLLLPPALYGALAGTVLIRRLGGLRPKGRHRKQARARLETALADAGPEGNTHGKALQALRTFLGAKLEVNASALTCADVERPLRARGASDATLATLKQIFEECEAHHYAGGGASPADGITAKVLDCAAALDKEIG